MDEFATVTHPLLPVITPVQITKVTYGLSRAQENQPTTKPRTKAAAT